MSINKRYEEIKDAVGDTSGYTDKENEFSKNRKIKLWISLGAIALLIVFCIIFFSTPSKVDFKFEDEATKAERHQLNSNTDLLKSAPKDPTRPYYTFEGWYFDKECIEGGLFNNDSDHSLLEYDFGSKKTTVLFAKWSPITYNVTYVLGLDDLSLSTSQKKQITNSNWTYNIVRHSPKSYEVNAYADLLRSENPELYVNNPNAQRNLQEQVNKYIDYCNDESINLIAPSIGNLNNLVFLGWYDNPEFNGNKIERIGKRDPREITLYAKWEQE